VRGERDSSSLHGREPWEFSFSKMRSKAKGKGRAPLLNLFLIKMSKGKEKD